MAEINESNFWTSPEAVETLEADFNLSTLSATESKKLKEPPKRQCGICGAEWSSAITISECPVCEK